MPRTGKDKIRFSDTPGSQRSFALGAWMAEAWRRRGIVFAWGVGDMIESGDIPFGCSASFAHEGTLPAKLAVAYDTQSKQERAERT